MCIPVVKVGFVEAPLPLTVVVRLRAVLAYKLPVKEGLVT